LVEGVESLPGPGKAPKGSRSDQNRAASLWLVARWETKMHEDTNGQPERTSLPGSSTIRQFLARHNISMSKFDRMQAEGRGPKVWRDGRTRRISTTAEKKWLADREKPSDAEARLIRRQREDYSRSSRKNSKASFAKGNHISQQRKAASAKKTGR
jgi:hypothetical protein